MAAYEVLLLNTAIPQIQAAQSGDTYVVPRDIAINATAIISANSATDALRITQTGAGNALVVEDSTNPDSSPFVVDASGNVGVGTNAPAYKLQLNSTSAVDIETAVINSAGLSRYGTRSSGNAFLGAFTAGKSLELWSAGAQNATLDASGNLGLGVTPSAWGGGFGAMQFVGGAVWTGVGYQGLNQNAFYNGSNWIYRATAAATNYEQNAGTHKWLNAASGTAGNAISFTQAMTLDASGNLLVGTTSSDGSRLRVYGTYQTLGDGAYEGLIGKASTIVSGGGAGQFAIRSASDLLFATNGNSERARITSSGDLLVGTNDAALTTGNGIKLLAGTGAGENVVINASASTNATEGFMMYSTGAGAYRFYVQWDGKINATSTTIAAISDERLKENIRNLDFGLAEILSLKPRRFDWKEGKGQNVKNAVGFIAQEFETVFPASVGMTKAGEDGVEYKSICHEELIPTLVKAIQELKAEVDSLKAQLEAK